jgi:EAL domain-containing protein (putative c-di-GMP-specific phosphodiesterase class I)
MRGAPKALPPAANTQGRQGAAAAERFVAFAFAAAELVVEIGPDRRITYAAGAFRTRLGQAPEAFVGRSVVEMIDPIDHTSLDTALLLLSERGRLLPLMIRLADSGRTQLALAGLERTAPGSAQRLCLTFAVPPEPIEVVRLTSPDALVRATAARLRAGAPSDVGLLQIRSGDASFSAGEKLGTVLRKVAPAALASEVAPGRFGLVGAGGGAAGLIEIAAALEAALGAEGTDVAIASQHLSPASEGLTVKQAARALRQALAVFARGGTAGLKAVGLTGGLSDYLRQAAIHADTLRRAIQERRFELAFQPIVCLADRRLHHYEALLRPKAIPGACATPQEFVILVETLGLAAELDLAVAGLVSEMAAASAVPIAFNVSGQSLQNASFRNRLVALLSASPGCRAGRLMVEMTETAEVEDLDEAARSAEALRAIGIPFCLDDFGAGAADVRLLRALSADIVKLDGSYVAGVVQGGRERRFVAAIIEIARAVKASVVAEWIETEAEAEALLAVGVTYGQGWLFGHPAPLPGGTPKPVKSAPPKPPNLRRRGQSEETWE